MIVVVGGAAIIGALVAYDGFSNDAYGEGAVGVVLMAPAAWLLLRASGDGD